MVVFCRYEEEWFDGFRKFMFLCGKFYPCAGRGLVGCIDGRLVSFWKLYSCAESFILVQVGGWLADSLRLPRQNGLKSSLWSRASDSYGNLTQIYRHPRIQTRFLTEAKHSGRQLWTRIYIWGEKTRNLAPHSVHIWPFQYWAFDIYFAMSEIQLEFRT